MNKKYYIVLFTVVALIIGAGNFAVFHLKQKNDIISAKYEQICYVEQFTEHQCSIFKKIINIRTINNNYFTPEETISLVKAIK